MVLKIRNVSININILNVTVNENINVNENGKCVWFRKIYLDFSKKLKYLTKYNNLL